MFGFFLMKTSVNHSVLLCLLPPSTLSVTNSFPAQLLACPSMVGGGEGGTKSEFTFIWAEFRINWGKKSHTNILIDLPVASEHHRLPPIRATWPFPMWYSSSHSMDAGTHMIPLFYHLGEIYLEDRLTAMAQSWVLLTKPCCQMCCKHSVWTYNSATVWSEAFQRPGCCLGFSDEKLKNWQV